jgi:ferredoxin
MEEAFRPDCSRLSCQIKAAPALDGLKLTLAPES